MSNVRRIMNSQESGMILAVCIDGPYRGLIGVKGRLPWRLPLKSDDQGTLTDSQFLREITTSHHHIIAGKGSVPPCGYPNREVHIASRSAGASVKSLLSQYPGAIVAGGAEIYDNATSFVDILYITTVSGFEGTSLVGVDQTELTFVDVDRLMIQFPHIEKTLTLAGTAKLSAKAEIRRRGGVTITNWGE